jgi:hypothetical protein
MLLQKLDTFWNQVQGSRNDPEFPIVKELMLNHVCYHWKVIFYLHHRNQNFRSGVGLELKNLCKIQDLWLKLLNTFLRIILSQILWRIYLNLEGKSKNFSKILIRFVFLKSLEDLRATFAHCWLRHYFLFHDKMIGFSKRLLLG